ncbi:DEK domain-containing chromatin-associated protein 4-like isoform X1 [Bidens hawaiensis]|uniref:DEK domain-containing chromatin-associated protein 4-like isoform X1 n=1 Tax=Bidens hawaiensis TaxID=980011 RepID=UPI00404B3712
MGGEGATSEVAETVENGTVSSDKAANDVNGKKEAVEKMKVDVKDNENDKIKEDEVNEEAEVKDNEGEGNKGNDEPEDEPMEVDGKKDANKETDSNNNIEADDSKEEEETPKEKGSKKGAKKKGGEKKRNRTKKVKEQTTPVAPTIERPVRARKSVERLVAVIENDAAKEFHILKGRGTVLKDIPNVSYKLSKKKVVDDNLKLLHTILFGRRGKAAQVKSNILQFSGFVWPENEEKHKLKVKEKLDKLNKEKLLEFCDIFDMTVSSANKEDIVVKLIDFMLTPHATTSELLAEIEQSTKGKKRKSESKNSTSTPEATPSKGSSKKQKTKSLSEEDKKRAARPNDAEEESDEDEKDDEDVNGATEKSEDEKSGDIASEDVSEPEPESESEEESSKKRKRSSTKPKSSKKESGVKPKEKKEVITPKKTSSSPQKMKPVKSFISGSQVADQTDSGTKTFSRKNKRDAVKEKNGKRTAKEKEKPKSEKQKISDGDLRTAICGIFKEVDFNTATFTDIVKLLAKRFDTDLTSRKASIKFMIQEELTKIADEAEDDEDDEEAAGKEASGQEVKA